MLLFFFHLGVGGKGDAMGRRYPDMCWWTEIFLSNLAFTCPGYKACFALSLCVSPNKEVAAVAENSIVMN